MNYKITFSYDGTTFHGYERQPNQKTIEQSIEDVLTDLNNGKKVEIISSGRTDKGVHANNQVANFTLEVKPTLYGLKKLLNKRLNKEIYIKKVEEVTKDFHARYDVLTKTYKYYINLGEYNVFERNYVYQYNKPLDIKKIQQAIQQFIGVHDYRSFCKEEKTKPNCVRNIISASITKDKDLVIITFTADGFLRKMVRNMVGLLIEVGSGKKQITEIKRIIDSKGKIKQTKSVPGCGLYLDNVTYKK